MQRFKRCNRNSKTPFPSAAAEVGGVIYIATMLGIGVSLGVTQQKRPFTDGSACPIASHLMDTDEVPVQLFSSTCMALAIILVIGDFVTSRFFRSRKKLPTSEHVDTDKVRELTYVTLCRLPCRVTVWEVASFGLLPIAQATIQCIVAFQLDNCWTTTGRVYQVIRSLFMMMIVVYFCLLMKWNVALFSESCHNVFMTYHVVATALHISLRTVIELKSFLHHLDFLGRDNKNFLPRQSSMTFSKCNCQMSTDASTLWITKIYANDNFQVLSFAVVVLVAVFVTFYVDVRFTFQDNLKPNQIKANESRDYTERSEVVSDDIAVATSVVVSLCIVSCTVVGYMDDFLLSHIMEIQVFCLAVAVIIIFLSISGIVIARQSVELEWRIGPLEVVLLVALVGVLCSKSVNIAVCLFGLYTNSKAHIELYVGIVQQLALLIQPIIQTALSFIALHRAGKFTNGCCGLAKVSYVAYSLAVLKWVLTCTDAMAGRLLNIYNFTTASYLGIDTDALLISDPDTAAWIRSVTATSEFVFSFVSFAFFFFISWKHNQVLSPRKAARFQKRRQSDYE